VVELTGSKVLLGYNQFLCAESLIAGGRFSFSLFEDLSKLIEAAVLYDHIILIGDYSLPSGILAAPLERANILSTMTDADVLRGIASEAARESFVSSMVDVFGASVAQADDAQPEQLINLRISPNHLDNLSYNNLFEQTVKCAGNTQFERLGFTNWISKNIFENRNNGGSFYYLARAILYSTFAEFSSIDYVPDLLRMPIAALTFSRGIKPLPKVLYDALVEKVHSEVDALILLGMPVSVFIPPLTAKLLSRVSDSPNDYPNELLQLRDKFSGFRKAYGEFLAILQDPNVTLKTKIDAKKKMISRITGIIDQGDSRHALHVKTIWDKIFSANFDNSGVSTKLSLSGLMTILIDQLSAEGAKGQARAIFDLWTDTLNLKNYGELLEKSFKTEIDPKEIEQYKKYSVSVRKIINDTGST
jgi:hypothetical protein